VVAFVSDDISDFDISDVERRIHEIDNIKEVTFVSAADALQEYKADFDDLAYLLEGLEGEENTFPNAFRIRVSDVSILTTTVAKLQVTAGIMQVNAPTDIAHTITNIKQAVNLGGLSIVLILTVVSLVIIANTIKITVYNRRKEINIMKFVGATDAFIRLPFIIEGLLLGLMAAVISYLLLWGGYTYLLKWITQNSSPWIQSATEYMMHFEQIGSIMFVGFCVAGIGVGALGSMIFVRKHLRV
ncbi:MAG: permease-like cell division protein FtsX, partial [Oscillospiraceae bacterium]